MGQGQVQRQQREELSIQGDECYMGRGMGMGGGGAGGNGGMGLALAGQRRM